MKNKFEMTAPKLSNVLGKMFYRSIAEPWKNEKTGEVTTKVKVLLDNIDEMVDVKIPGEVSGKDFVKNQEIDFENATLVFRAEGKPGFNNGSPQGVLNLTVNAEKTTTKPQKNA